MNKLIMIVSGEASGDLHGAALVSALKTMRPELSFCGMGGPEMARVGVELLADAAKLAVMGVTEVLRHLPDILRARRALVERMRTEKPALLILIDYPDFNLLLARTAKKLGIPVLYYVSPHIWIWRKGRVHTVGRLTDCVATILPFEPELYTRHGYRAEYVGHPLVDQMRDKVRPEMDATSFREANSIPKDAQLVGLLPGSREHEIRALLPIMLESATLLQRGQENTPEQRRVFLLPQAPTISRDLLDACGLADSQGKIAVKVIRENRYSMMAACDATLAASGTVTLELALLQVPTVTLYRLSPHTYWLGKLIIRDLPFFSLPNIVAGREVIPELLQKEVTPENLLRKLRPLLQESPERQQMLAGYAEVRRRLGGPGAAERTARIALELMEA